MKRKRVMRLALDPLFLIASLGYAFALYLIYPRFHEAVLFFAFRLRSHEEAHIAIAFILVLFCIICAAMVRDGIYAFANTMLLVTFQIPFLVLAPYFAPELMETAQYWAVPASSLILSSIGIMAPQRAYFGFGYTLAPRFETFPVVSLFALLFFLVVISFRDIMSFSFRFEIYDQRALYTEAAGSSAYFLNWLLYVAAPAAIILGSSRRSLIMIAMGISGELLVFLVNGAKAALAIAFLVTILSLREKFSRLLGSKVLIATTALVGLLLSYALDRYLGVPILGPLIADRTLYAHGIANLMIIEDFSHRPFNLWSTSFLRAFQDPVYLTDPFVIVGETYFNGFVRANTNFFGDGIINMGVAGALIMTLVTGMCLLISQAVFNRHDMRMRSLFIPVAMAITNGPIQVVIVTAGLGIIWALLLLMPATSRKNLTLP
jgi:hypothetical protein